MSCTFTMPRFSELLCELRSMFPRDWYLARVAESIAIIPQARSMFETYERAISTLNDSSWNILKQKAISHFPNNIDDRGKQAFFNQLNEAFAFRFLLSRGYDQIGFVPEDTHKSRRKKTPDIHFMRNNAMAYCEVKTLSISQDEIVRARSGDVYDTCIYEQLDTPFLESKLVSALDIATQQITSHGADGVIYLIVNFDNFTLNYYSTYRKQIIKFLSTRYPTQEVYIKVGIQSRKYIHHGLS